MTVLLARYVVSPSLLKEGKADAVPDGGFIVDELHDVTDEQISAVVAGSGSARLDDDELTGGKLHEE